MIGSGSDVGRRTKADPPKLGMNTGQYRHANHQGVRPVHVLDLGQVATDLYPSRTGLGLNQLDEWQAAAGQQSTHRLNRVQPRWSYPLAMDPYYMAVAVSATTWVEVEAG